MAITCIFGMTQSGKSFYVEHFLLRERKRKIVFDSARCFKSGQDWIPLRSNDPKVLSKTLNGLKRDSYFYVYKPARNENRVKAFDLTISWACALGRSVGERVDPSERVLLVCDEADSLCQPMHASAKFDFIINEGRHDNVDSVFICRDPNNLFIDARKNASVIVSFFQPLAKEMPFFKSLIGREMAEKLSKLPRFHYLTWRDSGEITLTNDKGKIYYKSGV